MTKTAWPQRLVKALSKFSVKSNAARFRDEYAGIIRSIPEENLSSRELLLGVRPAIESWVTDTDKCPCCALREWSTFYERASDSVPVSVRVAIAKKLPQMKAGTVDWQPFFFRCRQESVVSILFDRRMVTKATLESWITNSLKDAYPLPVLDLAIDNDAVADYRALWSGSLKWGSRPDGLHGQEEILAICYACEPAGSLDKELCGFLADNPSARSAFFKATLQFPTLYLRLAELLASRAKPGPSGDMGLVNDFVKVCGDQVQHPSPEMPRAALALASLRLFLTADANAEDNQGQRNAVVDMASTNLASNALTRVEEDTSSQFGACFGLLSAVELHDIVHDHLKSLTVASADSSAPAERSSQYERHLGKKEVLDKVISALDQSTDDESLREELDVTLFNLGVRPLGNVGATTEFDSRLHEAEESGIVPGAEVEIVEPGRSLGKDEDALVLSKAIVRHKK